MLALIVPTASTTSRAPSSSVRATSPLEQATPSRSRPVTLKDALGSTPALGVRRATRIAVQILSELRLAERSEVALKPVSLESVTVSHSETPFEQASLSLDWSKAKAPEQEALGLGGVASILQVFARTSLFLEDSLADETGRFGGAPLPRRIDGPLLRLVRRAFVSIAAHCDSAARQNSTGSERALKELDRLLLVLTQLAAARRPPAPQYEVHRPRPRRDCGLQLPAVLVGSEIS